MALPAPEPDQPNVLAGNAAVSPVGQPRAKRPSPIQAKKATPASAASDKRKAAPTPVEKASAREAARVAAEAKARAERKRQERLKAKRLARERAAIAQARKRLQQGDFASAARECRTILKQSPDHTVAKNLKSKAALSLKLSKQTQSDVDQGRCQKALGRLAQLKKLAPKAPIDKQIAFCRNGMPQHGL